MQAFRNTFLAAAATLALTAGVASAQDINKFVLSDAAAKKTLNKYEINADTARKIIDKCIDIATKDNMPITVFILSPTGQIVASHRMDGQTPINIDTALLKAKSVLETRDSSHLRANMIATNMPQQLKWHEIGVFTTGGGLPIVVNNQMIGSIGVGGGRKDEETAFEALEAVIGPQPPLAPNQPAR
jgi:glc operon protein GlcG